MAQPIPLTLPPRNSQHEVDVVLAAAPAKHAAAIVEAYEVLQLMHDKGVFDLVRGTLGGGNAVVEQAVAVASDAAMIRATRNAFLLAKTLAEIEPELLSSFTGALPKALEQAHREEAKPPSLFKLLRSFFNADFRRGLAAVNDLLEIFGRNLKNKVREDAN